MPPSDFTWQDVPNDPTHPLRDAAQEVLQFQADKDLDRIVVDVGTGVEECAYRDGAFRGLYAQGGSSIDGQRNVQLFRAGGWPAPPKVIPKVAAAASPGGQTWGTLYEVDLTGRTPMAAPSAGPYVIDGKTWYLKGSLASGAAMLSATGLEIQQAFAVGYIGGSGNDPKAYLHWFMPFQQLAGYNPDAPISVQFACNVINDTRTILGGIAASTNDGVGVTMAQSPHLTTVGHKFFEGTHVQYGGAASDANSPPESAVGVLPPGVAGNGLTTAYQFAVVRPCFKGLAYVSADVLDAGGFTAIEHLRLPLTDSSQSSHNTHVHFQANPLSDPSNLGFVFFAADQAGGSVKRYVMTRVRVSQPKLAAT